MRSCHTVGLEPISLVAKVTSAIGRPAVLLSDNRENAVSNLTEIARYLRISGKEGRVSAAVAV